MRFMVCPFCGVASEVAHRSQQACIEALQFEIERTRAILTHGGQRLPAPEPDLETQDKDEA